jgi:hypothetical protein
MNSPLTVWNKIAENSYRNTRDLPIKPKKPAALGRKSTPAEFRMYADALEIYDSSMVQYRKDLAEYHIAGARLEEEFRLDLEKEFGMENHPKSGLLYEKARELSSGVGFYSIAETYSSLVDLVK